MDSFWKGAMVPTYTKSIGTVRFVPLHEMGDKDWDILEYHNLRETAKNRIAAMIVAGTLLGFFDVNVLVKRRGHTKPRYLWPVDDRILEEWDGEDDYSFFTNEAEEDFESDEVVLIGTLIDFLRLFTITQLKRLVKELTAEARKDDDEDAVKHLNQLGREASREKTDEFYLLLTIYSFRYWKDDAEDKIYAIRGRETVEELIDRLING